IASLIDHTRPSQPIKVGAKWRNRGSPSSSIVPFAAVGRKRRPRARRKTQKARGKEGCSVTQQRHRWARNPLGTVGLLPSPGLFQSLFRTNFVYFTGR
ncbi:MAG: hypothetical protein BJ554DRAFT_1858, partial [Olpidium bornovanus]